MPFPDDLEDRRAKIPTGRLPHSVWIGIIIAVACVALLAISGFVSTARNDFSIDTGASSSSAAMASEEASQATLESADSAANTSSASTASYCQVYVVGSVKRSGVYRLPVGSRVEAAIQAAGGFKKDADTAAVNLARIVADGEQITVPAKGEAPSTAQGASAANSASAGEKVNINTASSDELQTLDGIGESTAAKIIASREAEGPFANIEDLKRVSGIGDKKFAAIAANITV